MLRSTSSVAIRLIEGAAGFIARLQSTCGRHRRATTTATIAFILLSIAWLIWMSQRVSLVWDARAGLLLCGAAALLSLMPLFAASRWQALLHVAGVNEVHRASILRTLFAARFVGLFTSALAADLGSRLVLALATPANRRTIGRTIVVDRLMDAACALAMLPAALLTIRDGSHGLIAAALVAGLVLPPVAMVSVRAHLLGRTYQPSAAHVAFTWACTALRWLCLGTSAALLATVAGLDLTMLEVVVLTAATQLVVVFAITPGAWGTLELGWIGLLAAAGENTTDASFFVALTRVVQVSTFGLGFAAVLLLSARARSATPPETDLTLQGSVPESLAPNTSTYNSSQPGS